MAATLRRKIVAVGVALMGTAALAACGSSTDTPSAVAASQPAVVTSSPTPSGTTLTCPPAGPLSAAAGKTYGGPNILPGGTPGSLICQYTVGGLSGLLVTLYSAGTPLEAATNSAPQTVPIPGLGNSASHNATHVFVAGSSGTFSVVDITGSLSLTQVEAVARAILAA